MFLKNSNAQFLRLHVLVVNNSSLPLQVCFPSKTLFSLFMNSNSMFLITLLVTKALLTNLTFESFSLFMNSNNMHSITGLNRVTVEPDRFLA